MNGLHLTADLYECTHRVLLEDETKLAELCQRAVAAVGLQAVAERWHCFPGHCGITGVVLLAESHLAIHTWPERAAVTLDVYVCNFGRDNSNAAQALLVALMTAFEPGHSHCQQLRRGEQD